MNKLIYATGKEMSVQDHRSTQFPLFVVMEDYEQIVPWGYGNQRRREGDELDSQNLCDKCKELWLADEDLPETCEECDEEAFVTVEIQERPNLMAGVFFTAKACEDHIKANGYHYNNPRSYGISAWRNEEMQEVMKHLIVDCSRQKLPSQYK